MDSVRCEWMCAAKRRLHGEHEREGRGGGSHAHLVGSGRSRALRIRTEADLHAEMSTCDPFLPGAISLHLTRSRLIWLGFFSAPKSREMQKVIAGAAIGKI